MNGPHPHCNIFAFDGLPEIGEDQHEWHGNNAPKECHKSPPKVIDQIPMKNAS
jgi:hypothetical protein